MILLCTPTLNYSIYLKQLTPATHAKNKEKPIKISLKVRQLNMSSGAWNHEVESSVAAGRLFKAAILDWHNLGPKIVPEVIVRAAPVSGDGDVGSIRELYFTSG